MMQRFTDEENEAFYLKVRGEAMRLQGVVSSSIDAALEALQADFASAGIELNQRIESRLELLSSLGWEASEIGARLMDAAPKWKPEDAKPAE